ncbi:MAG: TetR/AcrR family transcriptional regulator C-terminal domain-containing protein [Pseudomonadota bacterium]
MPSKSTTNPAIGSEHRDAMLHSLTLSLEDPHGTLLGLDPVLEREGYSHEEIRSAFGCIDDLLVAIAERKAAYLTTPLTQSQRIDDLDLVRRVLTEFGTHAWREYSSSIIALVRLMMAEGARSPDLRKRVYDAGPASVALELRKFFSRAHGLGVLSVSDAHLAAEQLMGMLREPLYQALMLRPASPATPVDASGPVSASIDLVLDGCARGQA